MVDYFPQDSRYYLHNELIERVKRRPHYSLRAFARDLGLSPAALSGFLSGKVELSQARILEIAKKIKLSEVQTEHWLNLFERKNGKTAQAKKTAQIKLEAQLKNSKKYIEPDLFGMISRWESLALLELLSFEKIFSNEEMADYLGMKKTELVLLLKKLVRLNLIYWNKDRWSPSEEDSFVGNEVPSKAIREFHGQILKKAEKALTKQSIEQREFRSTIFSMKKADLPQLKKDLNRFWMEQIGKYAQPKNNDAIYCFSMQLFDLLEQEIKND